MLEICNKPLKAISIRNPWADLIIKGIKDVENRTWKTKYNGIIFLHVSKSIDRNAIDILKLKIPNKIESKEYYESQFGRIIGCFCINNFEDSSSEWAEEGKIHWNLKNVMPFKGECLKLKGNLNLWTIPEEYEYFLLDKIRMVIE